MFSIRLRLLFTLGLLGALLVAYAPLYGQDKEKDDKDAINKKKTKELLEKAQEEYRVFFKKPETAIESWSAIKFEMDLGKFDLAGLHLKLMLEKPAKEVDPDLVKLEQLEGISAFLRLRQVRKWSEHPPFHEEASKNVEVLLDRVTKAVEAHLSDPVRIRKFIKQLDAPTPEERGYAYVQIARSRERAVPYLVEALRVNYGKSIFPRLRETMLRMGPETVPVYLEVFKAANAKDYSDVEFRLAMLDIIHQRDDKRVVPYLWHLSSAKQYPPPVREKAKQVLASMLRVGVDDLPPAKESLTFLAERHYQHKVPFPEGRSVKVWEWNGEAIALSPTELTPYQAEEFFGMRYAREAVDLAPSYQPAQIVLMSLMLERTYRPKVDQVITETMPPKMYQLLTTIDADLVMRVMERAMEDRQLPVILPLIQALGERGEFRAARLSSGGQPRGLVQGLYYPDRRVQFAAMKAMLRMPPTTTPAVVADRIVELSRRFLASDLSPKALIAYVPAGQEPTARQIAKDLGFEAVIARRTHEAIDKGKASADFDLVILHRGVPDNEFAFTYAQLRQDYDLGGLPMIVVVAKAREKAVKKFVGKDAGVIVITEDNFKADDELKNLVETRVKNVAVARLTLAERKLFSKLSMETLWRMARGEIKGYNLTPALDVIASQLQSKENAVQALEILGVTPGREIQTRLAGIVTDPMRDKLRVPATMELNRHIQANGLQLDKKQLDALKSAYKEAGEDAALRTQLTITVSMISRPTALRTGADLFQFRPDPPAAPKEEKKEKKDE